MKLQEVNSKAICKKNKWQREEGIIIKLEVLSNGMFGSNGYLVMDNGDAALIDAGVPAASVFELLKNNKVKLKYIFLTHGHIDHICNVDEIKNETGAMVLIHRNDSECLTDGEKNLSTHFSKPHQFQRADKELIGGEEFAIGSQNLKVIHTPGHSAGGCCFLVNDSLFSGDTLFARSIGRTDFDGGDFGELISSIKEKLFSLPEDTIVFPGHGDDTTIGIELRSNPFIR